MSTLSDDLKVVAPVPPMLETAIGYDGDARWVAFYWQPAGDEACWSDGQRARCGANWPVYLAYIGHSTVRRHLAAYNFGNSDTAADHYLLLDRDTRTIYAVPVRQAQEFLAEQSPCSGGKLLARLNIGYLVARVSDLMFQVTDEIPTAAKVAAAQQREQAQFTELCAWLNAEKQAEGR